MQRVLLDYRMNNRIRHDVMVAAVLLIGAFATAHRARGSIPYHPMDLVSYIGAYCAARDGGNPYDTGDARASLLQRGVRTAPLRFIYSPAFLGWMPPPGIVPYRLYRLVWIASGILSAWVSLLLLSRGMYGLKPLFLTGASVFLVFSEPMHDNLVCGQIMSFVLLALSVIVHREFRGLSPGVASGFLLAGKLCFLPLAFFFRGKRASLAFVLSAAIPCLFSLHIAGSHVFSGYLQSMRHMALTQGFAQSNNFSITHAAMLFAEGVLVPGDTERAGYDFEYRADLARRQRNAMLALCLALAALTAVIVLNTLLANRKRGIRFTRTDILSIAVLYLMVFIPCAWIHYGLLLILPFRTVVLRGRVAHSLLFLAGMMIWGMPFSMGPVWPRFLVPMFWLPVLARGGGPVGKVRASGASRADQGFSSLSPASR